MWEVGDSSLICVVECVGSGCQQFCFVLLTVWEVGDSIIFCVVECVGCV